MVASRGLRTLSAPASLRAPALAIGVLAAAVAAGATGCNPACKFRKTINEPENLSMRRSLLRKAMGDFCSKVTTRSAPLRLTNDSPVIGRFFPTSCAADEGDQINARIAGFGYAWTNVTKKLTFTMNGAASYRYDFTVLEDGPCDIYAYFRPARVDGSDFRLQRIESSTAQMLNAFTNVGETFGKQVVSRKLQEGFTVISYDGSETNIDFGLGIIPKGKKPPRPYDMRGTERDSYESERTEVHSQQRDFIGPVTVEGDGKAIFLTANVDGAAAVDVFFMRKADGDMALRQYFDFPQVASLPAAPVAWDVLRAGVEMKRAVPVPPGMYYVVIDNSSVAGQVSPPANTFDDRAAVVNYLIQVGDAS